MSKYCQLGFRNYFLLLLFVQYEAGEYGKRERERETDRQTDRDREKESYGIHWWMNVGHISISLYQNHLRGKQFYFLLITYPIGY